MPPLRQTFHQRRHSLALTQEEVATRAGLTRKTVSDFENGKGSISVANLSRLLGSVGLELSIREARRRPTLDELGERYASGESNEPGPRRVGRPRSK
jgi:transcriptional regulator with XRE-family HTH domain